MIHEIDESLRKVVARDALNGAKVEISFDAPTKEWASHQNTPTVNLYLYDLHEDLQRRYVGYEASRGQDGRVVSRKPPPRRFQLSYLITAWTKRPEDEHRLLSAVLGAFLRYEVLPPDILTGPLEGLKILATIALPLPEERSISDVWSAMGGALKPSLDLVLNAPMDTARIAAAGPPVLEEPRIAVVGPGGKEERGRRGKKRGAAAAEAEPVADETIHAGNEKQPGRIVHLRGDVRR
jgi:hypothetical protein